MWFLLKLLVWCFRFFYSLGFIYCFGFWCGYGFVVVYLFGVGLFYCGILYVFFMGKDRFGRG